jgi:hypothetical protein
VDQVEVGLVLSHRIKGLSFFNFSWHFYGGFFYTRKVFDEISVRLYKVFFCPILIVVVLLVTLSVSIVIFRCDSKLPNPILRK